MLLTVDCAGVAAAFDRDLEAKHWISDHVDPRRRRPLSFAENRYVLAPVFGKAAKTVEKLELATLRGRRDPLYRVSSSRWRTSGRLEHLQPFDLLGQCPAPAQQHRSRHGLENASQLSPNYVAPPHNSITHRAPPPT